MAESGVFQDALANRIAEVLFCVVAGAADVLGYFDFSEDWIEVRMCMSSVCSSVAIVRPRFARVEWPSTR